MNIAAERDKVLNPYMQRIVELASKGNDLVINDVKGTASDARSDRLDGVAITKIFICLN